MATTNFDVSIQSESVPIEVPMYGIEVAFDQIESIELSQAPLDGTRTNGFGGEEKSFGYFNLDDYGPVKLYTYANHPYHIDIRLSKGKSPRWVIFNQLTQEETETMYEALMTQWQVNE